MPFSTTSKNVTQNPEPFLERQAEVQQCLAQLFGSARAQFFSLAWFGLAWHGLNVAIAQEISQLNMI